jgi:hypothetical protein
LLSLRNAEIIFLISLLTLFSSSLFQILVEFDDLDWDKREWISIYKDDFQLFLLEENLVLAHRSSAPYSASHSGSLHPALVRNGYKERK